MTEIKIEETALRSARHGVELAQQVSALVDSGESVTMDFSNVEIMTPSFSNAMVMNLLERFPIESLRSRCTFANRNRSVAEAMNRAALRFQSGIRLSNQERVGA